MPKYVALRDNFTYDRYHYEGQEYELSDDKVKSPKNFRLAEDIDESPIPTREKPRSPLKEYRCNVCGKVVSTRLALAGHSRSHKRK